MSVYNQPSYGVLLCTYNGSQHIEAQIQSILNQTRLPDTLVIIDDGSTDNTIEIINHINFPPKISLNIIQRSINFGPAKNFIEGIQQIECDWIFFCDQDDLWVKTKIEEMITIQQKHNNYHLFFHNAELVDMNSNLLGVDLWKKVNFLPSMYKNFQQDNMSILLKYPIINGMCMLFSKEYFLNIKQSNQIFLHDEFLSILFGLKNQIYFHDRKLVLYRIHPQQVAAPRKNIPLFDKLFFSKNQYNQARKDELNRILKIQEYALQLRYTTPKTLEKIAQFYNRRYLISKGGSSKLMIQSFFNGDYFKYANGFKSLISDLIVLFK